jgi:cytidine deaminase
VDELIVEQAVAAATLARMQAYAPYSRFQVGACVVGHNGAMFSGCNVENASYGLTVCAERNAVFAATACGNRKLDLCVVVTDTELPTAPCGACRQVLHECNPNMLVVSRTLGGAEQRWTLGELLPDAFDHVRLPGNL